MKFDKTGGLHNGDFPVEMNSIEVLNTEAVPKNEKLTLKNGETTPLNTRKGDTDEVRIEKGKLNKTESKFKGTVGGAVITFYMKSAGWCKSLITLLFFTLVAMTKVLADWFVGKWMSRELSLDEGTYPWIYLSIILTFGLLLLLRSLLYGITSSGASFILFKQLFHNILRRPLSFFDTTPSGQIINRCVGDVADVDLNLPSILEAFLNLSFTFIAAFVMLCVISPVHLLIVLLFMLVAKRSTQIFVNVTTELKRLNQIAKSPLISTIGEMISGTITIRQYSKIQYMKQKFIDNLEMFTITNGHLLFSVPYLRVRVKYLLFLVVSLSVVALYFNKSK